MNNIDLEVINIASNLYQSQWIESKDVSNQTKKAQKISKEWQDCLMRSGYKKEVKISTNTFDRIDLLSPSGTIAYEMKVSGKNIAHEIFKDFYKAITYNLHNPDNCISDLVFISEPKSIFRISKRIDDAYLTYLRINLNLNIVLFPIIPKNTISSLLIYPIESWGLRGDPYLWLDLIRFFTLVSIPKSEEELKKIILEQINKYINDKIETGKAFYVKKYEQEGMSKGNISGDFWLLELLPNIIKKYKKLNK